MRARPSAEPRRRAPVVDGPNRDVARHADADRRRRRHRRAAFYGRQPRRRAGRAAAAAHRRAPRGDGPGRTDGARSRPRCSTAAPTAASSATSRPNWWSPRAAARRWPSWRRRWPRERQYLPFEPPHFGAQATVGGTVAAGLSGPRRMAAGALRDYVLGTTLLDGPRRGAALRRPGDEERRRLRRLAAARRLARRARRDRRGVAQGPAAAGRRADAGRSNWARPRRSGAATSGAASRCRSRRRCGTRGRLWVRLSGAAAAVSAAAARLGGERLEPEAGRCALAVGARADACLLRRRGGAVAAVAAAGHAAAGADRPPADRMGRRAALARAGARPRVGAGAARLVAPVGGSATAVPRRSRAPRWRAFIPLMRAIRQIHLRLKQEFDPNRIFNPAGCMTGSDLPDAARRRRCRRPGPCPTR